VFHNVKISDLDSSYIFSLTFPIVECHNLIEIEENWNAKCTLTVQYDWETLEGYAYQQ
jgi:hypothetical protein